jgi:hypothetical protein
MRERQRELWILVQHAESESVRLRAIQELRRNDEMVLKHVDFFDKVDANRNLTEYDKKRILREYYLVKLMRYLRAQKEGKYAGKYTIEELLEELDKHMDEVIEEQEFYPEIELPPELANKRIFHGEEYDEWKKECDDYIEKAQRKFLSDQCEEENGEPCRPYEEYLEKKAAEPVDNPHTHPLKTRLNSVLYKEDEIKEGIPLYEEEDEEAYKGPGNHLELPKRDV